MGFFDKIKAGLTRTKENIGHSLDGLFAGGMPPGRNALRQNVGKR